MVNKVAIILILSMVAFLSHCSVDKMAGGSTDTEISGVVTGCIYSKNGQRAAGVEVRLMPLIYSPVSGNPIESNQIDTTDTTGTFVIKASGLGKFTIEAVHLACRTRLLNPAITVNADTVKLPTDTIKIPGSIKLFVPDTIDTAMGYVYIQGTSLYKDLSDVKSDTNGVFIMIDSVPEAIITDIFYAKRTIPDKKVVIADTIEVVSNNTTKTEAFFFWDNYTYKNSGLPKYPDSNITDRIQEIYIDGNNCVWIGTLYNGIISINNGQWTYYNTANSGLPSNNITNIGKDKNGILLCATYGGVALLNGTEWTTYTPVNSAISSKYVNCIERDDNSNDLWVGTEGKGFAVFNGTDWIPYTVSNSDLPSDVVCDIEFDRDGAAWIGTNNGVVRFYNDSMTIYNVSNGLLGDSVYTILCKTNGDIWVNNMYGICKFDGSKWSTYSFSIKKTIYSYSQFSQDSDGSIWFGVSSGVGVFDGVKISFYNNEKYSFLDNIFSYSIHIDKNNKKWVGTERNGIFVF